MSAPKHTPGPWVVEDIRQSRIEITTATDEIIADVYSVWTDETTADEARQAGISNAALMAAAPELLEALHLLLDAMDNNGSCQYEVFRAAGREAIDRALGGAA